MKGSVKSVTTIFCQDYSSYGIGLTPLTRRKRYEERFVFQFYTERMVEKRDPVKRLEAKLDAIVLGARVSPRDTGRRDLRTDAQTDLRSAWPAVKTYNAVTAVLDMGLVLSREEHDFVTVPEVVKFTFSHTYKSMLVAPAMLSRFATAIDQFSSDDCFRQVNSRCRLFLRLLNTHDLHCFTSVTRFIAKMSPAGIDSLLQLGSHENRVFVPVSGGSAIFEPSRESTCVEVESISSAFSILFSYSRSSTSTASLNCLLEHLLSEVKGVADFREQSTTTIRSVETSLRSNSFASSTTHVDLDALLLTIVECLDSDTTSVLSRKIVHRAIRQSIVLRKCALFSAESFLVGKKKVLTVVTTPNADNVVDKTTHLVDTSGKVSELDEKQASERSSLDHGEVLEKEGARGPFCPTTKEDTTGSCIQSGGNRALACSRDVVRGTRAKPFFKKTNQRLSALDSRTTVNFRQPSGRIVTLRISLIENGLEIRKRLCSILNQPLANVNLVTCDGQPTSDDELFLSRGAHNNWTVWVVPASMVSAFCRPSY